MTTKTETAKQLMVLATDGAIRVGERLAALDQAQAIRRELKVGPAKLGWMDADELAAMRTDLEWACEAFQARGMDHGTYEEFLKLPALPDLDDAVPTFEESHPGEVCPTEDGFEMSEEELADQALRPTTTVTMAGVWQADADEGHEAFLASEEAVQADDPSMPMGPEGNELVDELPKITGMEQRVMRCFRTYDTLEGTQSDCGVSWTDATELAKQSGLPLASVKGVLGSLVQKGWVHADHEPGKPDAQCLTPEGAAVAHGLLSQLEHQQDFVPPTVVSEPPADNPKPEPTEAPPALTAAERGAIGVMSRDLLQTDAPYEEIALAVRARYPHARTTARSLASVAADMRRDGIPCPPRRKGGK